MGRQRPLNWSLALSEIKADKAFRPKVREELLRGSFRDPASLPMVAWRGLSGRRYVVAIMPTTETDLGDGVVISVSRDASGVAKLLGFGPVRPDATELHVHRLADTAAERAAVVADLTA